jgi:hypothetical protein
MNKAKKAGLKISLLMSLVISFGLSLAGNIASGHFAVISWLITFVMSFIVALIIGLVVPMKKVSDFLVEKVGLKDKKAGKLLFSSLISDIIYTPLITFLMVLFSVTMATAQINKQVDTIELQKASVQIEMESIDSQIEEYQSEYGDESDEQLLSQINDLTESKSELTNKSNGMQIAIQSAKDSIPNLGFTYLKSLILCMILGFILILIFQPLIVGKIMAK